MSLNIHDLYNDLERHRVMLSFKGALAPNLITALLGLVERKMDLIEPDHQVRKRVFNVVMECLQNLFHHTSTGAEQALVDVDPAQGVVVIAQSEEGYSVLTGNYMADSEVSGLREQLDHVNTLGPDGLRELYKQKLANGRYSPSGGGGLGIIDIARRSGQKLEYGFVPHDAQRTFFSLNVNVIA
jgi:Family of unknown function (DUF6272)